MHSEKTLSPMLGVGVFNIMFWIGFVVGYDIGLTCNAMLINALLFGGLGSYAVANIDRLSAREYRLRKKKDKDAPDTMVKPTKPILQT
ncbi:MAG: hypothetical protein QNI91_13100 [Arenicellales bacterium]|nr:hypothetical protein [Arenicellales bacterium]